LLPQITNGTIVQSLVRGEQAEQSDIKVRDNLLL
jgi:predicted nucleotidyltransferase